MDEPLIDSSAATPSEPARSLRPVEELFEEAERWLHQCGFCDFGLAKDCTCPRGDFRNVIADMLARLRAAEETLAAVGALHREITEPADRGFCTGCEFSWPCPTAAALAEGASR